MKKKKTQKAAMNLIYDNNIQKLRSRVKVLIVDDEAFEIIDYLKERKYDIYYKKDITYAIESEPFDIVIIDIHGVANALGSVMGGFAVAEEIKKCYPAKQVWCYSGGVIKQEIASKIKQIDGYIMKDTEIDTWCEKLDGIITTYCSKEYQANVLKEQLYRCNLSDTDIEQVLKEYHLNLEEHNFNSVVELLTGLVVNGKSLIGLIKMIYSFVAPFAA